MNHFRKFKEADRLLNKLEEDLANIEFKLDALYAEPTYTDPELEMQVQVRIDDLEDERIALKKRLANLRHDILHMDD